MGKVTGAHLVGSVPLASAEAVLRTSSRLLGEHLRRIPDGETGDRSKWVGWQGFAFKQLPQFELVKPGPDTYPPTPRFRVRDGQEIASFGDLGYADEAIRSFATFKRLQDEDVIRRDVRFQVSLPTPLAPVVMYMVDDHQALVEPKYEAQMLAELERVLARIPHAQLAIQWDVCIEVWLWERYLPAPFAAVESGILDRLARISAAVPEDVELGYHLCYGDYQHRHFHEPKDSASLVALANGIAARTQRSIQWIHMPVPIERDDDVYFQPMRELALPHDTEVYLGLVHFRDGVDGARSRIRAAQHFVPTFGVATECGMGRRPPERGGSEETLDRLLRIHAEVSDPVVSNKTPVAT